MFKLDLEKAEEPEIKLPASTNDPMNCTLPGSSVHGIFRQEYTEELYKKDLHDPDNHDDVITPRARNPGM